MNRNTHLSEWDVSNVEDMQYMFGSCDNFNQDISKWDVSNVKNMRGMFSGAHKFNQDISNWNVSNVTDMSSMFSTAFLFNQNIGKWDVSSVRNMASMFWVANSFDQSLDVWNVSKVEDMSFMFFNTKMFNGNIGKWDVSNVTNMESMFHGAQSFNQHLGHWNISKVENMRIMLENTGMFTSTYDKTLILWNAQGFKNKRLGAKGLVYCTSKEARDNLIKNGWRFEGDIFICPPVSRCSGSLSIKLLGYENVDISGGNPPYDTIFTSTEYYHNVTVVDSFGCYASDKLILNQRTFNKPSDMKIFPNPARSYININLDGTFDIELFDQLGRIIVRESNSNQIDVNKINSGIYYLKVNKFNHNTISEQVIIPIVISP